MPKIEGLNSARKKLAQLRKQADEMNVSAVTGYTQSYAIYVHEDMDANHTNGVAKYLEAPARQLSKVLADIVNMTYLRTGNLGQALVLACMRLQRESQMIVPIDTGALKASAFTALDKDEETAAQAALARSEAIRMSAGKSK